MRVDLRVRTGDLKRKRGRSESRGVMAYVRRGFRKADVFDRSKEEGGGTIDLQKEGIHTCQLSEAEGRRQGREADLSRCRDLVDRWVVGKRRLQLGIETSPSNSYNDVQIAP
jgi:hypothetical protein